MPSKTQFKKKNKKSAVSTREEYVLRSTAKTSTLSTLVGEEAVQHTLPISQISDTDNPAVTPLNTSTEIVIDSPREMDPPLRIDRPQQIEQSMISILDAVIKVLKEIKDDKKEDRERAERWRKEDEAKWNRVRKMVKVKESSWRRRGMPGRPLQGFHP